jgi:23S rRNA pseudouridine2457 synthase
LSSFTDRAGRPTVGDYVDVPDVYAAGRLDYDSEGLLLLTSDGRLARHITRSESKLQKSYLVQVEHRPSEEALTQLRQGVLIKGRHTLPATVELLPAAPDIFPRPVPIRYRKSIPTAWLKVGLVEGRNRQVRRMTAAVGHPALRLVRIAIGPIRLGDLSPGHWRDLTPDELKTLWHSFKM